jgi:glutathione peroxidase
MKQIEEVIVLQIFLALFMSAVFANPPSSLYEIQAQSISGQPLSLSLYKEKVLLIVNTASQCGFTPQLRDLEIIYKKYKGRGFEVLAFPSNDFKQDPGENGQIASFAEKNYEVTFPFFAKGSVSGPQKQAVYAFLTSQKSGVLFKEVQWNFEKFLVDRNGRVLERWSSMTSPNSKSITEAIEKALGPSKDADQGGQEKKSSRPKS